MAVYLFPGQGSQFSGMGKELYDSSSDAKELFHKANNILGFDISSIMFDGSSEDLKQTKVTQPAIFIHSVIAFITQVHATMDAVAGHSLGEISALVANQSLSYEKGLEIVKVRALAMQHACEKEPSTMAAILGLEDDLITQTCEAIPEIVIAANFNCKGQVVISGSMKGIEQASEKLKELGAKRVLPLPVGGAFHSPLMKVALQEFESFVNKVTFSTPICPVYQNIDAHPHTNPNSIKANLIQQLVSPVKWTQTVLSLQKDGFNHFIEVGPGKVLQGLVKKTFSEAETEGIN